MNEKYLGFIQRLETWQQLNEFEKNAVVRGQFSDPIRLALKSRANELGSRIITEKTGLVLTDLTPAEQKIVQAVGEYVGVMRRQGKHPQRTYEMLGRRGLIKTAETAVCKAKPTQGFQELVEAELEHLSFEQIVVDHPAEFSQRALWFSRRTLALPNPTESPPADEDNDTHTRSVHLLHWLKSEAAKNDGRIPPFTNADAAIIMGIDDMQRYGKTHGNIQSRIDLACFHCNLPPLGLTAEEPFSKAWSKGVEDWKYPIRAMQSAAQNRQWTPEDFDNVLREAERLSGQAHISWREVERKQADALRQWAASFGSDAESTSARADPVRPKRNADWSSDELILALDLYLRHRSSPPSKDSAEVLELSELLNRLGQALHQADLGTYRNPSGVYMKMMNFRSLDPQFTVEGKVGLDRRSKGDIVVWNEYSQDVGRLALVAIAIRRAVDGHAYDAELSATDEPGIVQAPEGRVLTRIHRVRERSGKLVEAAKARAMKRYGRLCCEACGLDFKERYGGIAEGIIDVHHTKPLHTLIEGDQTSLEDLALLCANCHRVVHSSRNWLTIEQVRFAFRLRREALSGQSTGDAPLAAT